MLAMHCRKSDLILALMSSGSVTIQVPGVSTHWSIWLSKRLASPSTTEALIVAPCRI
jgi:hypothetical protein